MAAARFEIRKGTTGKFRFLLIATNGQVVATSESYETKRAAQGGIASVQKIAAGAEIVDTTAKASAKKSAAKKTAAKKTAAKKTTAKRIAKAVEAPAPSIGQIGTTIS
jgi:uncharacterized protein YegP (UPF0339 family)